MTLFEQVESEVITLLKANDQLKNFTFISSKSFFNEEELRKEASKNAKGAIAVRVLKANPSTTGNSRLTYFNPSISIILFNKDLGYSKSNLGLYVMIDEVVKTLYKEFYQFIDDSPLDIADIKGTFAHGLEFRLERNLILQV